MKDMKAMVMTDIGRIEPGRLPVPSPGPGEALIRVKSVGICGSDVHYFHDGGIGDCKVEPPFLLGHECAGEVVALGEGVQGLCVGDRVALEPGIPCGKCEMCMTGRYNLCPDVVFFATPPVQGVLCEYVAHPASLCFKLPDTLDFEEGALIEPLAVGFHAGLLGGARVGKSAAVLGSGCIGLVTLLAIRAMGVTEIYMSDVLDNRLAVAEKLGAVTVNAAKEDAVQAILEKTQGRGVDLVFEAAGNPASILQTASLVARGGTIVLIGLSAEGVLPFDLGKIMNKEAEVKTVFRYRNVYPLAIEAVRSGRVDVKSLVTHRYAFEDSQRAFSEAVTEKARIVKGVIQL